MRLSLLLYALSWALVATEPALWPVAALGFGQNLAHTFVSRGRNSGSLGYHLVASVFSNGIYISLLVLSISIVSYMKASGLPVFVAVYVLATMSGSVTAHALAMRLERGKARNVQEDRVAAFERRVVRLEGDVYGSAPVGLLQDDGTPDSRIDRIEALERRIDGLVVILARSGKVSGEV